METYYRVCDRNGWSRHETLEHLDYYLKRIMADGNAYWPIKRIVKVTSEDIPFTETARRYNDLVAATPHRPGTK